MHVYIYLLPFTSQDTTFYVRQPIEATRISSLFFVITLERIKVIRCFFRSPPPFSSLFLFPCSLSSAPMSFSNTSKTRFKQTIISPFVPDAFGVTAVPPGLGTTLLEISAVAGDLLAVGAPHYSIPALTDIINEKNKYYLALSSILLRQQYRVSGRRGCLRQPSFRNA